jgi:SRSO17 transposase
LPIRTRPSPAIRAAGSGLPLTMPRAWTDDRDRCRQAGIPDDRCFATKPELARQMINRALEAGMPFGWVAADEVYGQNGPLRDWLEERHVSYVLAVPKSFPVATAAGLVRADHLAALVPAAGWQQVSCGDGSKGPRYYDWALITTTSPDRHLLVRRSLTPDAMGKRALAFFTCHAPACTALAELVRVAGTRWAVEECFQAAKNETGLDHYQVRRYDAWYRHATLSMLALAFLQVCAAQRGHQRLWTTFPDTPAA